MINQQNRGKRVLGVVFFIFLLLLNGCIKSKKDTKPEIKTKRPTISHFRINDDFVIVKVTDKDTFSSLAAEYLNDPNKDWLIVEINDINVLNTGQEMIIPLNLFKRGGLQATGYQTVPVLAYKSFSKHNPGKMSVTEAAFEDQMKYLKGNGYHVITLRQLLDFIDFAGQVPEKSVVITVDDGWRSLYDIAFPILKKYGFSATLFVYTDFIGGGKAMSWKQVREFSENGFDIQCKTRTHRNLARLKENESFREYFDSIEMELEYPKKLIKKKLNKSCSCLAYPYGETNNLVVALLKKHGYRAAFTARGESNPFFVDNYRIHRSEIYGYDDIEKFKKKLSVFKQMELK